MARATPDLRAAGSISRDDVDMHLTTAEASLASVLIGGLIGALGGSFRDRHNERKDHLTRLWEKEIQLYESLLLEADATKSLRNDLRMRYEEEHMEDWEVRIPDSGLDEITKKRTTIQLAMFGRLDVQKAHEECDRLLKECVIAMARLASLFIDQEELTDAQQPQAIKYLMDLHNILEAGDQAQEYLTRVISVAATRIPTTRRRRLPFLRRRTIALPTSSVESDFWDEA